MRCAAVAKSRPRNTNGPTRGRPDNEGGEPNHEDSYTTAPIDGTPERPSDEPDVQEIVERCREVAAATGFAWLHDLVLEELERLDRKLAA